MAKRIACTALTGRIVMGNIAPDMVSFKGPTIDVTSDVLKAVIDKLKIEGGSMDITANGKVVATLSLTEASHE